MDERSLLDLIISLLPALKLKDRITLCEKFTGEDELIKTSKGDIEAILEHPLIYFWDIDAICEMAHRLAEQCKARSIQWVGWSEGAYPPLLRQIYDPPPVIYYRGLLPPSDKPLLGMVGTRKPSPAASAQAFTVARDLGRLGISVVSGLALGIDAISHRGNLEGGAATFAVLGSGVDEIYPSANRPLARRILETGGAILSEYPPGTFPYKSNFPARNRIISGLSRSVLIVEAPLRSGALITAEHALEQGRELWVASCGCAEDNAVHKRTIYDRSGTANLVRDGAEIVKSCGDILEKWKMMYYKEEIAAACVSSGNEKTADTGRELSVSMAKYLDIEL
ncbi:MAG: DNA-processing protein DprA [Treponema sp.]|nr:DNA-processing protein DprA [Treponema sp.]